MITVFRALIPASTAAATSSGAMSFSPSTSFTPARAWKGVCMPPGQTT